MKIVQFTAENVKRLKLVQITPKGHMVEITGKNGQGKTSVLDAIWYALGGKENLPSVPIRKGQEKGRITLDLGEFIVERRFTAKDSSITVKSPDGAASYNSPQKMLDALVGSLSFDPLEFARADAAAQFAILRQTVKPDIDFEKIAVENKADYEERTRVNKTAKEQRAIAANIMVPEGLPDAPIDETALDKELRDAYDANAQLAIQAQERQNERERIDRSAGELDRRRDRIEEVRKELKRLEDVLVQAEGAHQRERDLLAQLPPLPEKVDVDTIRKRADDAKGTNRNIQRRDNKLAATASAEVHEGKAAALTKSMADRETAKLEALKACKMPVDGLGFGDGIVTLNELPFDQASDAERLRVSIAIAMATNPKLRVIRIRDGSLLDEDSMKVIAQMAKDGDFQFWVETVGNGADAVGIVLEDGEVKSDNQEEEQVGTSKSGS